MTLINNQWVGELSERVFANTSAFNAETPMAGRKEPLEQLRRLLTTGSDASCAVISEQLGAGKTFFVQHAFSALIKDKERGINEEADWVVLAVTDVSDGTVPLEADSAKGIIIEELDRKADRYELETAIEAVSHWLNGDRKAILTGDFVLQDPELLSGLEAAHPIQRIPLEPLDQDLLLQAIQLRLYHWLRQAGLGEADAKAAVAETAPAMFDPRLLAALVPPTRPPVATFREVLGLLQKMAVCLPLNTDACRFTPDTFREWSVTFARGRRWTTEQAAFVEALHRIIGDRAQQEAHWQALNTDEWAALIPQDRLSNKEYEPEILMPLVRAGVLIPMGIPYSDPQQEKAICGPYLPSVHTFATALLS